MARGRRLTEEEIQSLRTDARDVRAGELRRFAEEHAAILGCHPTTIYRAIRAGVPTGRRRRSDAGELRALEEEALKDIAAMVTRYDYDAQLAIDTWNAARVARGESAVDVHPETVRRHLRELGVSRRHNRQDLRHHRRFEAPYPGYLFQMDSTVAAQWYIDDDDTIGYEAAVVRNKNKAGNGKPRIWLIAGVDDHTRVRWGRAYTANSALAWHDFMLRCWRGFHPDPVTWPAFGVPERVYTDQDSAMKSAINVRALELLGVQRLLAKPSSEHETNAQAKGKSEAAIRILQTFEKITRWKRFTSLEEWNEALLEHLIWLNNQVHSGTGKAPFERWLGAKQVVLLPPAEITRRMSYREDERVIASDVSIQLAGKTYQLPQRKPFVNHIGAKVQVRYLEADLSTITVVLDGEEHEVEAVEARPDVAGEYHAAEVPDPVALKRELLERDLSHIDPHAVVRYRTERDPRAYPIRPPTVLHPLTAAAMAPRMIRRGKAIDRAQEEGVVQRPPTAEERAALDAFFAGRSEVPEPELQEWIAVRRDGGGAQLRVERA